MVDAIKRHILDFFPRYIDINKQRDWWKTALVATAAADERFDVLKKAVGPDHLLPSDLLAGAASVFVFFLPFRRELAASNVKGDTASRSWAEAYVDTNRLIAAVNDHISGILSDEGYRSAATPATHNFDEKRLISGWSHKHIAHIAGLGRLGMHTQLITPGGCCGRLGSLVTDAPLGNHPLVREEALCLHKAGKDCLACIKKCRFGALTEGGFDRFACYKQLMKNDTLYGDLPLTDVCGKCVAMTPCSFQNPVTRRYTDSSSGPRPGGRAGRLPTRAE